MNHIKLAALPPLPLLLQQWCRLAVAVTKPDINAKQKLLVHEKLTNNHETEFSTYLTSPKQEEVPELRFQTSQMTQFYLCPSSLSVINPIWSWKNERENEKMNKLQNNSQVKS